ncbi:hypothetical protein SAMN00120144_1157 [Hymenobacter roseosalivarius DSM 11622]|uniref:Uncharacterized protein n=1 Tax=Hymenobacter roseosalivarius DSM 11622 TaxID=645990 RepID=A0A1W1V3U2_9BACT|nr:hypothetical protein SAMN00120144_1157 [Hymenobacter roseosalivarius DSM 11622]
MQNINTNTRDNLIIAVFMAALVASAAMFYFW